MSDFERLPVGQPHAHYTPSSEAQTVLELVEWNIEEHLSRPRCSDRDARICDELIVRDATLESVAEPLGVTRELVRQILRKHTGLSVADLHEHRATIRETRRLTTGHADVTRLIADNPGILLGELVAATKLNACEVVAVIGDQEALRRRRPNTWTRTVPDHVVINEMRRVAALPGGSPLSTAFWDAHRRDNIPKAIRLMQRWGTWRTACEEAQVPANSPRRNEYARRWSRDELLDWVRLYLADAGSDATYADCSRWLRDRKQEGAPSASTLRNEFRAWSTMLSLALDNPHDL